MGNGRESRGTDGVDNIGDPKIKTWNTHSKHGHSLFHRSRISVVSSYLAVFTKQSERRRDVCRTITHLNGMYPVTQKVHNDDFDMKTKRVHAEEWTTYSLATKGHERRVQTYEVTLGNVQRVQLGWSRHLACSLPLDKNLTIGIGDTINTYALDLTRSSFLTDGRITPVDNVDNLNQNEGTVVRSEDFGKSWYINGDLVAINNHYSGGAEMFPFISVKGEIEVAVVELQK